MFRIRQGWLAFAFAAALFASCQASDASAASDELPQAAAVELQAAANQARANLQRELSPYINLGNPYTLETKRRQAQAEADAYLASVVQNLLARYPTRAEAIVHHAVALAPESRRSILAVSGQVVAPAPAPQPALPDYRALPRLPDYAPGPSPAVPGSWYGANPAGGQAAAERPPAPPPLPLQPVGNLPSVPMNWYEQPKLAPYGAPRYQQPALPGESPPPGPRSGLDPPTPPAPTLAAASGPREERPAGAPSDEIVDPLEPLNRGILAFNDILDFALLKPAATVFSYAPGFVKDGLRNLLANLRGPVIFANDMMQFTFRDAARTFDRFVINSTLGVGGLWDPADRLFGIRGHHADFGQTLYSYGAGPGPYLVLPLLGPSNLRDGFGIAVDSIIDPWAYFLPVEFTLSRIGATALSKREELLEPLDELRASSLDWYAGLRSAYYQSRAQELLKHPGRGAAGEEKQRAVDDLFDVAE